MQLDDTTSESVAASLLPDQGQGVPSSKLVYDDAVDTSTINQVLFIDSNVQDFQNYANANTFPIIYDRMCTREQMLEVLSKKFTSISRIAFVNHFSESPYFLNQESLFSEENKQFVVDIITQFQVSNVDYLACNTLSNSNWLNYYSALQAENTGIIIGASSNNTGNIKYGGDWIMESTNEDIHAVYFNDQIQNYASLLATIDYTTGTSTLRYTYTSGSYVSVSVIAWVSGTEITIPSTINISGSIYNVTNIDSNAFKYNTGVTSVILPSSIRTIGLEAFSQCTNMVSVNIPNEVYSIGVSAFYNCTKLTSINIPYGIAVTPTSMCENCSSLTSITIPSTCTSTGWRTFKGCANLTSVILPSSFLSFGVESFTACRKLASMVMPSSVTSIGSNAFQYCNAMTSVVISPLVTIIPDRVFNECSSLTSIVIPSSVTSLGIDAFAACVKMNSITIPSSVKTIDISAFIYCFELTYVVIPPIKSMNINMFAGCSGLTSIIIPSSVTRIYDSAFLNNTNLKSVYFMGNNIPTIDVNNFTNATDTAYYLSGASNTSALTNRFATDKQIPLSSADLLVASSNALAALTKAPAAPIIISITAGDTTATITFAASPDNGSPITNYEYSADGSSNWTSVSSTTATITSPAVITGLNNGTSYTYYLRAVNGKGNSAASFTSVTATPRSKPSAPTNLSIIPGVGQVTINFTDANANGSPITNYEYSADGSSNWTYVSSTTATITSPAVITGLNNGTSYTYYLRAVNGLGSGAASTTSVTATPRAKPSAPTNLSIIPGNGQVTINFTDANANGSAITNYEYSANGSSEWTSVSSTTATITSPAVITGLNNGQSYTYYLRAVNGAVKGAASTTSVTATPYTTPAKPNIINIIAGNKRATINFTDGSNNGSVVTNYKYSIDGGSHWTIRVPESIEKYIIVSNLENGSDYNVKILAINKAGEGAVSTAMSVTPGSAPDAPTLISVDGIDSAIAIKFSANADNGYPIDNYMYSLNNGENWTGSSGDITSPIVVSDLSNNQIYYVRLKAANEKGESSSLAVMQVTPAKAPNAPIITDVSGSYNSIAIKFTEGANNGSPITNYKYSINDGTDWTIRTPASVASPLSVTSKIVNGTPYNIVLKAINKKGVSSKSNAKEITAATIPAAPTITKIKAGDTTASIYFATGAANGSAINSYLYSTDSSGTNWIAPIPASTTTSPIVISDLSNNQTYYIRLKAVNGKGEGSSSGVMQVTPAKAPAAPIITDVSGSDNSITIKFTEGENNGSPITNYKYSTNGGEKWTLRTPASRESPMIVSRLIEGLPYSVKIKAKNAKGVSVESDAFSITLS